MRLSDFIVDEPTIALAKREAARFIEDMLAFPFSDGCLLTLCGKSGTGKTMLARIIMNELRMNRWGHSDRIRPINVGAEVILFTARFYDMRKVSDGFKHGNFSVTERMEEVSLCILDDVGADQDPSKTTAGKVDRVLRSRANKWTVMTSNLSLSDIGTKLDARIASFVVRGNNRFVEIKADDFAKRKERKV
jgi:DNA replication protein DnaC